MYREHRANEQFLRCFASVGDGACGIDHTQRIVLWNTAAERLLGFARSEVHGRYCYDVFGGVDLTGCRVCRHRCPVFRQASCLDTVATRDLRVHTRAGRELWLSVTTLSIPPPWSTRICLIHLFRDVSRQKVLERGVAELVSGSSPPGQEAPAPDWLSPRSTGKLTSREREVLGLLASGSSTRCVAETLMISPSTVRNHVHNILYKLQVHSRLEAVTRAHHDGLL